MDDVRIPPTAYTFSTVRDWETRKCVPRHDRVDEDFLTRLSQDVEISEFVLRRVFLGMPPAPRTEAIELCEWAVLSAHGDVEEAGELLRGWGRKKRRGAYDPRMHDPESSTWHGRTHYGMEGV